ncbi:hypothetical protein JB92DRAFT_3121116 [Gautieria morchelliformis]|nr:hypothetical protein JB92DRAFT_3121116 [Gautieria morchelliformis]
METEDMPGDHYQDNPCGGPLWMPSDRDTRLGRSLHETAVLDLAQGLEQYLGMCDVPAHQNSGEDSQDGPDSSSDKALELPIQQDGDRWHGRDRQHQRSAVLDNDPWYPWPDKVVSWQWYFWYADDDC